MSMLQGGEIIIILLIALLVFGPKRLPELAQKLGQWTAELRAAAKEVRSGLKAEVADLKAVADDLKAPLYELRKPVDDIKWELNEAGVSPIDWTGPETGLGPTPADAMADLDDIEEVAKDEDGA